jgi:hypothetical protein
VGVLILMCLLWVFFLGVRSVCFDRVFIVTHLHVVVVGVLRSGRLKMRLCFSVLIGVWPARAGEFFLPGPVRVGHGLYITVLVGEDCG